MDFSMVMQRVWVKGEEKVALLDELFYELLE